VLDRHDFVEAAPAFPGDPRVRLPPALFRRYDDETMVVFHPHPKQQRLVAHWKKSQASMVDAWVRRNRRQVVWSRRTGAGGTPRRLRIRRIVDAPTR
jgi:hypothetical protein